MIDQLFVVLRAPAGIVSVGGLFGVSLGARIHGHHVVVAAEVIDLRLPDFRRHGPSGNEEDGGAGAAFQVVQLDAVAGGEEITLHRSGRVKHGLEQQDGQKKQSITDLAHSVSPIPGVTRWSSTWNPRIE